jgi:hypothetical protein
MSQNPEIESVSPAQEQKLTFSCMANNPYDVQFPLDITLWTLLSCRLLNFSPGDVEQLQLVYIVQVLALIRWISIPRKTRQEEACGHISSCDIDHVKKDLCLLKTHPPSPIAISPVILV